MTQDDVKAILDRVLTWPRERQEEVIELISSMEDDADAYRLTEEQAAEVRRRLADPNPEKIPFEEVFGRFRSRGV